MIVAFIFADLMRLENLKSEDKIKTGTMIKNRKRFLKIFENLSEKVGIGKNHWEDSSTLIAEAKTLLADANLI
jgi:hypothetical protein